ncbi:unnamed protein product [Brassica rapa]|uniref:ABC transporter domain-containing protein n=1 Tax=Brassica campestris TaxID=3711 RepID=A0A3P5ZKK1_BRACM|nr:unnamed protein product [Brassica rapa]VDC72668.1 unnamed protein product [Brassica rapa]
MLGENGTGRNLCFISPLFWLEFEGIKQVSSCREFNVSYKPQVYDWKRECTTLRQLLHDKIHDAYTHPQFVSDAMRPLQIETLLDQTLNKLSDGERQRFVITLCLGKPARYLSD